MTEHRIRWFARLPPCPEAPDGWLPRTAAMRGTWGWDVRCSCGKETQTGGGTTTYIRSLVWSHKWNAEHGFGSIDDGWYTQRAARPILDTDHRPMPRY